MDFVDTIEQLACNARYNKTLEMQAVSIKQTLLKGFDCTKKSNQASLEHVINADVERVMQPNIDHMLAHADIEHVIYPDIEHVIEMAAA